MVRPQATVQQIAQPINPPLSPTQPAAPNYAPGGRPSISSAQALASTGGVGKVDPTAGKYNTAPNGYGAGYSKSAADEFGGIGGGVNAPQAQTMSGAQIGATSKGYANDSLPNNTISSGSGVTPRPRSSGRGTAASANRLTVANFGDDMPEEAAAQAASLVAARSHARQTSLTARNPSVGGSQPSKSNPNSNWMTAEDEKKILYERAVAGVERVQGASPTGQVCYNFHHWVVASTNELPMKGFLS